METSDPKRLSKICRQIDELKSRSSLDPANVERVLYSTLEELETILREHQSGEEEPIQPDKKQTDEDEENRKLLIAVQEEREKLSALINSIGDEVWFADTQKRFTLANPPALQEFRIGSDEEIDIEKFASSLEVYRPDGSLRPVEEAPPLRALMGEVVKNQEEIIRTPANRELRYRQVSANPVRDAIGNIIGSVSVVRDITDYRKMDKELMHLASFPHLNPNPIVEVDQEGCLQYLNNAAKKLFPDLQEKRLSHPWLADWDRVTEMFLKSKTHTCVRDISINENWYQQLIYSIPDLQRVRIYGIDITERKKMEDSLLESRQRYVTTLASIGDAIIATDIVGNITFMNWIAEELTGWHLDEALNLPTKTVFRIINEYTHQEVEDPVAKVLEDGIIVDLANHTVLVRRDGTQLAIDDSGAPIRDSKGNITGVVLVFRDVTERKHREKRIDKLTQLYAVLSRVNETIIRTQDEGILYSQVCQIVAEGCGFPIVWIGEVKELQVVPVAWFGAASDYLKEIRVEVQGELGKGPTGTCIREDRCIINDDFATNPATRSWRKPAFKYGFRASAAFPIHRRGKAVGAFTLYAYEPKAFDEEQVILLESLCSDISYALDALDRQQLHLKLNSLSKKPMTSLREGSRKELRSWRSSILSSGRR